MRPLYFILKFTLMYALNVYFRRVKVINKPKKYRDNIIFVLNHPSAFLDPLLVAEFNKTIIHFMVRSDIFKWWLRPVTWMVHMMPIYRSIDGVNTKEMNQKVFNDVFRVLKHRKGIIIFGEGFTDDVFIRSLKPVKKGAARMAFGAMEENDWKLDVKICCVGINYSDPNVTRSDTLISNSEFIHVKDYREMYDDNPSKASLHLTREINSRLRDQITYVEDKKKAPLHEHVMRLTKMGMNPFDCDRSIPLEDRYRYSKNLALKFNTLKDDPVLDEVEEVVNPYFKTLKKQGVNDRFVEAYQKNKKLSSSKEWFLMVLLFPIFVLGLIHNLIPYLITKRFVEKSFKRRVFWGGVKMMLGKVFIGLYNIPLVILLHLYLFEFHWISWPYYFIVPPITGLVAYQYKIWWSEIQEKKKVMKWVNSGQIENVLKQRKHAVEAVEKINQKT